MTKTAMVRARIEPALKREAEDVMNMVGISPTEAIRLFYRQVSLHRGLPFEVRIPNAVTRKAMAAARDRKKLKSFMNAAALRRATRT
jgi:DNA-damage-inducible protein J